MKQRTSLDKQSALRQTLLAGAIFAGLLGMTAAGCSSPQARSLSPAPTPPPWLAAGKERPRVSARRLSNIVVDGNLDEWPRDAFLAVTPENGVFDAESAATRSASDVSYRFAVAWDDAAFYVAVEVDDDRISVDSTKPGDVAARVWEDDGVEIFLDGDENRAPNARDPGGVEFRHGGEFSLAANGAATSHCSGWPRSFGNPAFWSGVAKVIPAGPGGRIVYELRFAWAALGRERLRAGDSFGFTIGVQDDDGAGRRAHALYWTGASPHCWKDENGWGEVRLLGPAARTTARRHVKSLSGGVAQ